MKHLIQLLSAFGLLLVSLSTSFAQTSPADHPQYTPLAQPQISPGTTTGTVPYYTSALSFSGNSFSVCDSGATTIIANGNNCGTVTWYADSTATMLLSSTDTLNTSMLSGDTTYYLSTVGPNPNLPDSLMPLPNHASTFSGNVRGYYFVAPTDFIITGLRVPTDANTSSQHVEIVRFTSGPPPVFSAVTNAFDQLGRWINYSATDTIPTCIFVNSGDIIGIYGNRNDANSYAPAPASTTIDGMSVTLTRSGMQLPLSTNNLQDVFSENGGSISRVEMFYKVGNTLDTTITVVPVTVTVNQSVDTSLTANICMGDSILLGGAYQTTAGTYYDTLTTVAGCDSVVITTLSILNTTNGQDSLAICMGDSILLGGAYQTTAGAYVDTLTNMVGCDSILTTTLTINMPSAFNDSTNICMGDSILLGGAYQTATGTYYDTLSNAVGCDSIISTQLTVKALPSVALSSFVPDTLCVQGGPVALPAATPIGGTYTGVGVSGNDFDPAISGTGTFTLVYSFTDQSSCSNSDTTWVTFESCMNLSNIEADDMVKIFPNPVLDVLNVQLKNPITKSLNLKVVDALGKTVLEIKPTSSQTITVDLSTLSAGTYFLLASDKDKQAVYKLTKH